MHLSDIFLRYFRGRRQSAVMKWAVSAFGDIAEDPQERINRFIEESIELAQALGVDKDRVCHIVNYVYSRPVGEIFQEVGGASLTLLALCETIGINTDDAEAIELERVLGMDLEKLRAKQNSKAEAGVGQRAS